MPLTITQIREIIDLARIFILSMVMIVFAISFFVPLFKTYIPYLDKVSRPSGAMITRLLIRLGLFMLALHGVLFSVARVFIPTLDPVFLIISVTIVYIIVGGFMIYSWGRHPDGMRGL